MPTKPEGPAQEPQGDPLGKWYCPKHKLRITDAYSCPECFEPVVPATPAPAAHTEPHGAFFQPHVIPKVKGCPDCEAMAKRVTVLGQTRPENVGLTPLMEMCDREWSDETPEQVIAIAANAIYWRNREIQKLRGHSAPSQPAGAREWAESHIGDVILIAGTKLDGLKFMLWEPTRWVLLHDVLTLYLAQQTAAKDAELKAAERERDSLRELLKRLNRRGGLGLDVHEEIDAALKAGKDGQQ